MGVGGFQQEPIPGGQIHKLISLPDENGESAKESMEDSRHIYGGRGVWKCLGKTLEGGGCQLGRPVGIGGAF